jgi:hypothetical protein
MRGASRQHVCIAAVALMLLLFDPIRAATPQYGPVFIGIFATELAGQDAVAEISERVELGKEDIFRNVVGVKGKSETET